MSLVLRIYILIEIGNKIGDKHLWLKKSNHNNFRKSLYYKK